MPSSKRTSGPDLLDQIDRLLATARARIEAGCRRSRAVRAVRRSSLITFTLSHEGGTATSERRTPVENTRHLGGSLDRVSFPEHRSRRLRRTESDAAPDRRGPALRRRPRRAALRQGRHPRPRAGRLDARRRPAHPGEPPQGGAGPRRPRRPRGDPLRDPRSTRTRAARAPTIPTASSRSRSASSGTRSATRSSSWPTTASTSTPTTATAVCIGANGEVDNDATLERYAAHRGRPGRRRAPTSSRRAG